jgi:ribosomal protein S27AE
MKLHLFEHTCSSCEHVFLAPHLSSGAYGTFLLRGDRGELALLNALESAEFEEFSTMLRAYPEVVGLKDLQFADLLIRAFSASDFGEKGGELRFRDPVCPHCGSGRTGDMWKATNPPQLVEWEPVPVTFRRWAALGPAEKQGEVRTALDGVGVLPTGVRSTDVHFR